MFKNLNNILNTKYRPFVLDLENAIKTKNGKLLLSTLPRLLKASIQLLKEYFCLMGLYPVSELAIIRASHYNEIITDGHTFMRLYHIIKNKDINRLNDRIIDNSLLIFKELEEYIQNEVKNYGN